LTLVPGGTAAGRPQLSTIQISRDSDVASPTLALMAATGRLIDGAQIVLAGGALTIELSDVTITGFGTDSTQNGVPIEKIGLAYRRLTWTFNSGSSSTQASFDAVRGTGASGGPLRPNFVFFGQGVDPSAFADETPFSKLALQLTSSGGVGGGGAVGRTAFSPLTLVTGVGEETIRHLGAATLGTTTPTVRAHITALDTNGATIDRLSYTVEGVNVTSVAIESTPTGALQETLGLEFPRISWTARSLTGGAEVTTGWDIARNRGI
jgi:type VI protein secretion system component Hcp